MKKLLIKGLTVGMVVAMMTTGLVYADTTLEEKVMPEDRLEQMKERMNEKFENRLEEKRQEIDAFREMSDEERIAALEEKLENDDLSEDIKTRIQTHIDAINNKIEFDDMLEDLLAEKTNEEKVVVLQELINDSALNEKQERHVNRLIEKYTIGEEVLAEIKAAFDGVAKEDRGSVLEALINSGNYTGEALEKLLNQQEKQIENESVRAELEEIRSQFDGLTKEEREEKLQEIIESGGLSDAAIEKIQKNSDKLQKMGDNKAKIRDNMKEDFKEKVNTLKK